MYSSLKRGFSDHQNQCFNYLIVDRINELKMCVFGSNAALYLQSD